MLSDAADLLEKQEEDIAAAAAASVGAAAACAPASGSGSASSGDPMPAPAAAAADRLGDSLLAAEEQFGVKINFMAYNGSYVVRRPHEPGPLGTVFTMTSGSIYASCRQHPGKCQCFFAPSDWEAGWFVAVEWLANVKGAGAAEHRADADKIRASSAKRAAAAAP